MTEGFKKGEVKIVIAGTNVGKSMMAEMIALAALENPDVVVVDSMPEGIRGVESGDITIDELASIIEPKEAPVFIERKKRTHPTSPSQRGGR